MEPPSFVMRAAWTSKALAGLPLTSGRSLFTVEDLAKALPDVQKAGLKSLNSKRTVKDV